MRHWFDTLAMDIAGGGDGISRRKMLKGAGIVAFAASPLASPALARAAAKFEGRAAASPDCDRCLNFSINATNANMRRCDKTGSLWQAPAKKGKTKTKARPVNAAKRMACAMQERALFARDLNECRIGPCNGEPLRPLQQDPNSPFKPQQGGSACPAGMTVCPDGSCCFGGDLCCYCIHSKPPGFICCIAVVGCGCCPQE